MTVNGQKYLMRRQKYIYVLLLIGIVALILYKADSIHNKVQKSKNYVYRQYESYSMHKNLEKAALLPVLNDEPDGWYTKYHFIAHGGGGIDGKTQTDSIEAWNNSYKNGIRVIDADLTYTLDGKIVLRHSWGDELEQDDGIMLKSHALLDANGHILYQKKSEHLSYADVMSKPIFKKYHPIDLEGMLTFMKKNKDVYMAVDTHAFSAKRLDIINIYRDLVAAIRADGDLTLLDRIIVNIYSIDEYDGVMNVYPFKNVTMRQHGVKPNNYYDLLIFCLEHNIHVVNTSARFMDDEGVKVLIEHGIHIYTAVVDYISDLRYYHEKGASGAITNFLHEDDWNNFVR